MLGQNKCKCLASPPSLPVFGRVLCAFCSRRSGYTSFPRFSMSTAVSIPAGSSYIHANPMRAVRFEISVKESHFHVNKYTKIFGIISKKGRQLCFNKIKHNALSVIGDENDVVSKTTANRCQELKQT